MRPEQKMRLFVNEPGLVKDFLQRSGDKTAPAKLKTIFPPAAQLERFKQLEQAREHSQQDLVLDKEVQALISHLKRQVAANQDVDRMIEARKDAALSKLKMDYVEEQMSESLEQLAQLLQTYEFLVKSAVKEKEFVENMIVMTEIKKALALQNDILKRDNENLKKQEHDIDSLLLRAKRT